ncbi:HAD hydrolase-like protein [Bacillus massiliigorillae]|uniref:HAD hydrolase-like protein n=1 Tax=Bacillus massiliigorillae TaxID=1243664 RepID=UPI00039F5F7E|nr:HAD hydrolase-like protein [Bacillus massiliigorillae]
MKQYVIFDFDGTLADSQEVAVQSINQLAGKYGFPQVDREGFSKVMKDSATLEDFSLIANEFYSLYKESLNQIRLFDGMKDVLLQLHEQGYGIAVISSNEESNIRAYFATQGLEFITDIYTSSNLFGKDEMLNQFSDKYKVAKNDLLYVGDEVRDIQACHRCGVSVVWVPWGYAEEGHIRPEKPTYKAKTPADILMYAKQMTSNVKA